ncbi:MAG: hypothetical protein COV59_04190 [Candidatus Magasanikbacteria bacterium CG11_big_fil_rev_8_21_14_0_20_39_34]|uniref:Uncharacterized protein n=1 Tax=Candidatus Magasanikbacteria bacterium CG11_big_fil_rev_8_21_14_0_20_39_34 TaxID=1974653 RepID=A0A2H0N4L1_9BACT|nr:MAG: hypothetical protein COV59_04190 [Candidatus Magasanikbacteria bacterium CG11_big_fil_rev_8_21_14_0_20_39_34]
MLKHYYNYRMTIERRNIGEGLDHLSREVEDARMRNRAERGKRIREEHENAVFKKFEALSGVRFSTLLKNIEQGVVYFVKTELGTFKITGIHPERGVIRVEGAPYPDFSVYAALKISRGKNKIEPSASAKEDSLE